MFVFYFFAAISIWLGVLSLRSGLRFARFVRQQLIAPPNAYCPAVTIIAPCRGIDQGFAENVGALLRQEYAQYEVLFVTEKELDEAVAIIESTRLSIQSKVAKVHFAVAGEAVNCGQKVHNLRHAAEVSPKTEVLVFVDSDARPAPNWLRSMVSPLADTSIGAATGYRWFVPVRGGFASNLRSVWNASIASALGEDRHRNFCWGGSTAIRRSVFEDLRIRDQWRGSVSDDFTMTRVLQEAKLPVQFVPMCLVPSFEDCSWRELLTFTNRQLKITRVYAPHLWKPLFVGSAIFNLTFFGGLGIVIASVLAGSPAYLAITLLLLIFLLGALKSGLRFRVVNEVMAKQSHKLNRGLLAHVLLWPMASLLQLVNCFVATISQRIVWRGITYELKSPNETVIIDRD
jgi:cellulose synthase/poly-beta-1,6-N-acetylglucosamine synthase-like glycosyltransferase